MTQCRILLVDDEPQVRSYIHAILNKRNYRVDQATDGIEAVEVLRGNDGIVDLLITDIKMPRMDGVALARAAADLFPMMPVLFISAWADPLDSQEWWKPQYAFLRKPFLPKALFVAIDQLLEQLGGNATGAPCSNQ